MLLTGIYLDINKRKVNHLEVIDMMIQWESRKTLEELTTIVKVKKYYAEISSYYLTNEECNDRGFSFYADVVKHIDERVEITEKRYLELKSSKEKPVVFRNSKVNGYKDTVKKLLIKNEEEVINLLVAVKYLISNKKYKQALKKLEEAKSIIQNQFVNYNDVFKDEFIDKWNQSVQEDLDTIESKIQNILELQEKEELEKQMKKLIKVKKEYEKLLEKKHKYSDTYFAQLEQEFFDKHQVTKDMLLQ